ncbi:MAG TPA: hypothetical protein VMZ53_34645 [Kofleriaceae bacterium]|nr:hypothetical protein [Kofleriaceae bacterium]
MRGWLFLTLAACNFEHGALGTTGGSDDAMPGDDGRRAIDAMVSVYAPPEGACLGKWKAGPTFTDPVMLANVNTTGDEADPFVSADEQTLYFVRTSDIYKATRTSLTASFQNVAKAIDLSSSQGDSKVSLTADGLTAFVNTARTGGAGGATDIWRMTRSSTANAFANPDQMYLMNVNGPSDAWDPHVSANGLRIYFAPPATPAQHIVVTERDSTSDPFGTPKPITELDSGEKDNDPTLTADERLIVWASNRGGNRNLWYALRDDPTQPFGTPTVVPQINTNVDDGPHISNDGCRLYFTSDRDGDDDVWFTELQ